MADDRTFIKVHDGMPDHPKIEGLSDGAFRLLITLWCWCSRQRTDGHVRKDVWAKRGTARQRKELLAVHPGYDPLVEELPSGDYLVHDYLEHQRSAAEIAEFVETRRDAGAKGNHARWHVKAGVYDPDCKWCVGDLSPPTPPANLSHERSHMGSQTDGNRDRKQDRKTSPEAEAEAEAEGTYVSREGHQPDARRRPPRTCPKHAGDPDPPNCGKCAAARREHDLWQPDTPTPVPMSAHLHSMPPVDPELAAQAKAARQPPAVRSVS